MPTYWIRRTDVPPGLDGRWGGPAWCKAEVLRVGHFHPASSDHRPLTLAKLLHDDGHLYGMFRVQDRYVVCRHSGYQTPVYKDSCAEFFVRPKPDKGYLNFELNCGGGLLLYYISNWARKQNPADPDDEFEAFTKVPEAVGSRVAIYHSLPVVVDPENQDEVEWLLEFHIPVSVLETYVGPLGKLAGQEWRANFNKCADESSHPHWASWSPIGAELNLHQPDKFGVLCFE